MMISVRERIVAALVDRLRLHLPGYDIRRSRQRAVDRESQPSVSVSTRAEEVAEGTIGGVVIPTLTIEIAVAAALECESEIDPVMVAAHRVAMAEDVADDFRALARAIDYTGCTWEVAEGGDGFAVVATMTFTVIYAHATHDMTAV